MLWRLCFLVCRFLLFLLCPRSFRSSTMKLTDLSRPSQHNNHHAKSSKRGERKWGAPTIGSKHSNFLRGVNCPKTMGMRFQTGRAQVSVTTNHPIYNSCERMFHKISLFNCKIALLTTRGRRWIRYWLNLQDFAK